MTLNDSTELTDPRREDSGLFDLQQLSGPRPRAGHTADRTTRAEPSGVIRLDHLASREAARSERVRVAPRLTPEPMAPVGYQPQRRLALWLGAAVIVAGIAGVAALVAIDGSGTARPASSEVVAPTAPPAEDDNDSELAHAVTPIESNTLDAASLTRAGARAAVHGMGVASLARERAAALESLAAETTRIETPERRPSRPEREPSRTETVERTESTDSTHQPNSDEPDAVSVLLERTRRPQTSAPDTVTPTSAEPLVSELSVSQISRTLRGARPELEVCRDRAGLPSGQRLRIDVRMTIGSDGRVATAHTDSDSGAAACVLGVLRGVEFEATAGDGTTITYPLIIR